MSEQRMIDITKLAVLGEQFSVHLMRLGFRLIQVVDRAGQDQFRYVRPPVCMVPAGPFLMGSDKEQDPDAEDKEMPQHTVLLPVYEIARYPLTVAEYACFVSATRHPPPRGPTSWLAHMATCLDYPVVFVSWHDVVTYTDWLAHVTGERWRLPTEAEWEKAARGTDGRIYPWGNHWDETKANTNDGGPATTTPVGSYPSGASPYGAQDMAGNVLEWSHTTYQPYPYQANGGREEMNIQAEKVLRGGSWSGKSRYARAACRYSIRPTKSDYDSGVRLVRGGVAGDLADAGIADGYLPE